MTRKQKRNLYKKLPWVVTIIIFVLTFGAIIIRKDYRHEYMEDYDDGGFSKWLK